MSAIRPTAIPDWATGSVYPSTTDPDTGGTAAWSGTAVRSAPSGAKVLTGWIPKANAAAEEDNSIVGTHGDWINYLDLVRGQGLFGSGTDGAYTLDGVGNPTWATRSGATYTLVRDVFFTNLTLTAAITFVTSNFKVFGTGTLTVPATAKIHCNGPAGIGIISGTAIVFGSMLGGAGGGTGGTSGSPNAGAGAGTTNSVGGAGGPGKTGGGSAVFGTGGAPGAAVSPAAGLGGPNTLQSLQSGIGFGISGSAAVVTGFQGGGGGGGGGYASDSVSSSSNGGGGGAGGGLVSVWFANVVLNGSISADGGAGGNAAITSGSGYSAAGGSGGGGGRVVLGYARYSGTGTVTAALGAGGVNTAAANTGNPGVAGTVILCDLSAAP